MPTECHVESNTLIDHKPRKSKRKKKKKPLRTYSIMVSNAEMEFAGVVNCEHPMFKKFIGE